MALSPLLNVPIARQDTTIDIVRKGDGSQPFDDVVVTTTLELSGDIDTAEVTLLLPLAGAAQQKPLLRWTEDDPAAESVSFDPVERSVFDQGVADALADFQDDDRKEREKLAKAIAKAAKGGISQAVLTVKPGQRQLRFFYTIAAFRQENGTFTFDVLGPLASFVLQTGGSLSAIALLPRGSTLVEAHAYSDPANLSGEISTEQATLAQRQLLGWYYQNDPLFRIIYRY
jgi:hypothetical protein